MNNSADYIYDDAPISSVAWAQDASLIATAADATLMGWVLREDAGEVKGERFLVVPEHDAPVCDVAFSNGGKLLASASGNLITVRSADAEWDEISRVETSSAVISLEFCCYNERQCWSPLLAYGTANGDVGVLDLTKKKQVAKPVHQGRVNSVRWMGFAHTTLVSAGADRRIVESSIFDLEQTSRRKAPSQLLSTPYRPNGVSGKPYPSIFRNDNKLGMIYNRRIDTLTIGTSYVSARRRTIEYGIAEGQLATLDAGNAISSLSWLSDYPFNYATGDKYGEVLLYGISLRHRPALLDNWIRWISTSNVSVDMEPIVSVQAHRGDAEVTAIAYPAIGRSGSVPGGRWLMASGASDGVKFWDIDSLRSSISYEGTRLSTTHLGIGAMNGVPRNTIIRVRPEEILRGSLSGVSARRKK